MAVWWKLHKEELRNTLSVTICTRAESSVFAIKYMILLTSCQHTCMTYTTAVCTVKNSWWWTEELSETCRVLFQK